MSTLCHHFFLISNLTLDFYVALNDYFITIDS